MIAPRVAPKGMIQQNENVANLITLRFRRKITATEKLKDKTVNIIDSAVQPFLEESVIVMISSFGMTVVIIAVAISYWNFIKLIES